MKLKPPNDPAINSPYPYMSHQKGKETDLPNCLFDGICYIVPRRVFRRENGGTLEMVPLIINSQKKTLVWVVVSNIFYFYHYLGKISNLTNIFQMG